MQAPTDISGARHVSTLKNTTYKNRPDENLKNFGKKVIDENKIVQRISTYQRGELNQEERAFGGLDRPNKMEMEYKSSRIEYPRETHTEKFV